MMTYLIECKWMEISIIEFDWKQSRMQQPVYNDHQEICNINIERMPLSASCFLDTFQGTDPSYLLEDLWCRSRIPCTYIPVH